ncbi:hypothetical protein HHI36_013908 [Cryptolaemus montrouzieri]|uniref:Uncharacterized protein n=1 Tax=Cryptolaemus montrouzieri TaxID=559131 RepID=A0ABD2N269_9CUCU
MNITPNEYNFKWVINTLQTAITDATSYIERRTTKNIKGGWFTEEVKRKMNERNKAYKNMRRFAGAEEYINTFKTANNIKRNIWKNNSILLEIMKGAIHLGKK